MFLRVIIWSLRVTISVVYGIIKTNSSSILNYSLNKVMTLLISSEKFSEDTKKVE